MKMRETKKLDELRVLQKRIDEARTFGSYAEIVEAQEKLKEAIEAIEVSE